MRFAWVLLAASAFASTMACAQTKPDIASYTGTLGSSRIGMTLVVQNGKLLPQSHYFYASHLVDIPLTGTVAPAAVDLHESGGGQFALTLKGNGSEGGQPLTIPTSVGMTGSWSGNGKSFPVSLTGSGGPGDYPTRWYHGITSESDAAFEAKPKAFYKAVLADDRDAAARYVSYPLRVNTGPDKFYTVTTPAQFKAQWGRIFSPAWLKGASDAMPHEMSVIDNMAMLGNGLAFFSDKGVEVINTMAN